MNILNIRFRLIGSELIQLQIIYNCIIKFFIGHLHVPASANYLTDVITLILLWLMIKDGNLRIKRTSSNLWIFCFIVCTVISFFVNGYSPFLYFWGARNIFRFFIFFSACIYFLKKEDIDKIFSFLEVLFWINVGLALFQRWILHYIGDGSSGLYSLGNMSGGNGSINVLMCIVIALQISKYLTKEKNLVHILVYIIAACVVASSIELKIFFIEILVLIIFTVAAQGASEKGLVLAVVGLILLNYGTALLERIYPAWEGIFNIQELILSSQTYGTEDKIGRLSGMSYMMDNFLKNPMEKLFGIGFGNADYSSGFSIFTSNFYQKYGDIGYVFFSSAWLILETGIIGVTFYLLTFGSTFWKSWKLRKERSKYVYFSIFSSIIVFMQFFYNQMLRVETSGYLLQFCLAVIFVYRKEKKKGKEL